MAKPAAIEEQTVGTRTENRGQAFLAILHYAKPHRLTFLVLFVCIIVSLLADLIQPYLVKIVIDDDLANHRYDLKLLFLIGGTYLGLSAVTLVLSYVQNNLLQHTGQTIISRIRKDLFAHITKLSMSFFDRNPIGSLVTNVSSDTETINQFFTQVLLSVMRDGVTLILIIVILFRLDVKLAVFSLVLIPIILAIAISFRTTVRRAYQNSRSQLSRLVAFLAENLSGMSLIQAFHQENNQYEKFTQQNQAYLKANLKEIRTNVMFNRSFEIIGNLSVAFITWLGGIAVFHHQIAFGVLYAFISYIRQFFQPINQITQQWNTFQSTLVSVERVWRIFSVEPEVADPIDQDAHDLNPSEIKGKIEFDNVSFSYSNDIEVLHQIQLTVQPGEFVGIVGATGAGKSSIMSLLMRFYDVKAGSIRIDGIDVRQLKQETLHHMIGLVQQEPFLFSGTILDNIRLFDMSIQDEDTIAACRFVGADEFISKLKDGYLTKLSERGNGLSAGERQLLSFARIVVHQPRILILDEATANLDSQTEQKVQQALSVVSKQRTTLVIAHRLSTVMHADRIIVMKHGEVIESGKHESLLRLNGYYAELYRNSVRQQEAESLQAAESQLAAESQHEAASQLAIHPKKQII